MEESRSGSVRWPVRKAVRLLAWVAALTSGGLLVWLVGCASSATPTGAAVTSRSVEPAPQVPHEPGAAHEFTPGRLEAIIEIDMGEFFFGDPQGDKNPTFRLPAGRTVGLHIHNEGLIVHDLAIGRGVAPDGGPGYGEILTELVPVDLFFYYGRGRVEVEDAHFGEMEVDAGLRDIWIRMNVPEGLRGEWQLGCFTEGHYEAGMKATLIVE